MKVALVVPHTEKIAQPQGYKIPQLGAGYLAASLVKRGFECEVIDGKMQRLNLNQVLDKVKIYKPDVVGITSMTHEIERAHLIAQGVKAISADITTVIGGCHVTAIPEETLDEFPFFDYGMAGEGEDVFPELLKEIKSRDIIVPGAAYRRSDKVFVNNGKALIKDINSIPMPAWELFPKTDSYPLLTSRGCPFKCIFCMRVSGDTVRYRSVESLIAEIERLISAFGAKIIYIRDETFNLNINHTEKFLDLLIKENIAKKIKWYAIGHVGCGTPAFYKKMKEAGCIDIGFGVESGNEQILRNIKKNITLKEAQDTVDMAQKAGLRTTAFYILGHPNETRETLNDTIKFAAKLNTSKACFGAMVAYPGTDIYRMAKEKIGGYNLISRNWESFDKYFGEALGLLNISAKELKIYQLKAYLYFYFKNFKVISLLSFFASNIKPIMFFIAGLIGFKRLQKRG